MSNSKELYLKDLKEFLIQALRGGIIAPLTMNMEISLDTVLYLYIQYLNMCWHSYNKKDDDFIVRTFDKLLNYNLIKGSVCLFSWLKEFGLHILGTFNATNKFSELNETFKDKNISGIDNKRMFVGHVIENIFDILFSDINLPECKGDLCDNSYDGKDLFIFSQI